MVPGMVLALLVLFARLVAAGPMPVGPDFDALALRTICHAGPPGEPGAPHAPGGHDACLLCPACHLLSHAAVPLPAGPLLRPPVRIARAVAVPMPPSTGPPGRFRPVPAPTGPPVQV